MFAEIVLIRQRRLFDERVHTREPAGTFVDIEPGVGGVCVRRAEGQILLINVGVVVNGERPLLQVIGALHTSGRLSRRLHGGKKKTDQNSDNRDYDK